MSQSCFKQWHKHGSIVRQRGDSYQVETSHNGKRSRVTPQAAKRRRQRFVEMSDNLLTWLAPYSQSTGPISPPNITFRRTREKVLERAKVKNWLRDALRHTYRDLSPCPASRPGQDGF